jgi:hypothetical protein
MYKVIYWRYRVRYIDECSELSEAEDIFNSIDDSESGFSECILDENDIIINDGFVNVLGLNKNRIGEKYIF